MLDEVIFEEQNRSLDYRADLYSLGVTLYELFTGVLPHESDDPLEMVHFHIAGKPMPPRERSGSVPVAVSDIVMKLLQKEPENRYQSATGLAADLSACVAVVAAGRSLEPFPLGLQDVVDRFEPPQKLYGRSAETQVLLQSFERVARGSVEAVMVAGQAGIGKTTLVQEIYQPITLRRGYFIAGKFDQLQQNVPFSALVTALHDLVQQLLTESEEQIAAWRRAIDEAVHPNGQLMVDVVPALELIIGKQPRVAELEAFEAQNRFNLVFQNFLQVFCKSSHPLVLFLDDMQWADAASLNLVTRIVSARATESLLLVTTYRDNEVTGNHPLTLAAIEQAKQGVQIHSISERRRARGGGVRRRRAAIVKSDAMPLAEVAHQEDGGNPFSCVSSSKPTTPEAHLFRAARRRVPLRRGAVKNAAITENADFRREAREGCARRARCWRVAVAIGNRFELGARASRGRRRRDGRDPAPAIGRLIAPLRASRALILMCSRRLSTTLRALHDRSKRRMRPCRRQQAGLPSPSARLLRAYRLHSWNPAVDVGNHLNHAAPSDPVSASAHGAQRRARRRAMRRLTTSRGGARTRRAVGEGLAIAADAVRRARAAR
jgi:hypothetical protein